MSYKQDCICRIILSLAVVAVTIAALYLGPEDITHVVAVAVTGSLALALITIWEAIDEHRNNKDNK